MPHDHSHRMSHDMLRVFPRRRRHTADAAAMGNGGSSSSSNSLLMSQSLGLALEGSTLLSGTGVERRAAGAALRATGAGPVSAAASASQQKEPSLGLSWGAGHSWGAGQSEVAEARALPPPSAGRSATGPGSARVSEAAESYTSRSDSAAGEQSSAALTGSATYAAAAAGPDQQPLEAHKSQALTLEGLLAGSGPAPPAAALRDEASSSAGEQADSTGSLHWGQAAEGSLSQRTPAPAAVLEAGLSADESGVSSSLDSLRTAAQATLRASVVLGKSPVCESCLPALQGWADVEVADAAPHAHAAAGSSAAQLDRPLRSCAGPRAPPSTPEPPLQGNSPPAGLASSSRPSSEPCQEDDHDLEGCSAAHSARQTMQLPVLSSPASSSSQMGRAMAAAFEATSEVWRSLAPADAATATEAGRLQSNRSSLSEQAFMLEAAGSPQADLAASLHSQAGEQEWGCAQTPPPGKGNAGNTTQPGRTARLGTAALDLPRHGSRDGSAARVREAQQQVLASLPACPPHQLSPQVQT